MQNNTFTTRYDADRQVAQVFFDGVNQTVRLPDELRFKAKEVFIRRVGDDIILSPKAVTWDEYFATGHRLDADFPEDIIEPPMDIREDI